MRGLVGPALLHTIPYNSPVKSGLKVLPEERNVRPRISHFSSVKLYSSKAERKNMQLLFLKRIFV